MAFSEGNDTPSETGVAPYGELARRINEIPQEKVREALYAGLPANGRVEREALLRSAAHLLGFSKLGSRVRIRLNRAIGAEKRAGRLDTDWASVWRAEDRQPNGASESLSVRRSPPPTPTQSPTLDQDQVAKAILEIVQGHLYGVSREKIPGAVSERLGLQQLDPETLRLLERTIVDLANKGFLKLKAGGVYPA